MISATPVPVGSYLSVSAEDDLPGHEPEGVILEVVECIGMDNDEYLLRCRLNDGDIPAQMILNW